MASVNINDIELVRRDETMRFGPKKGLTRFFESAGFSDAIMDIEISRTIEGASTLTIEVADPDGAVADMPEFQTQASIYPTEVRVANHWFALAGAAKSDGKLTLTFEDREVNALRRYRSPRKAKRARLTRAEFCRSLVQEATIVTDRSGTAGRIDFISPESQMRQIIGEEGQTVREALAARTGFPAGIRLKYLRRTFSDVKKNKVVIGRKWKNEVRIASKTQLAYYDKIFRECQKQRASGHVARAAALMALSPNNLVNMSDQPGKPPGNLFGLPRKGKWIVSSGSDPKLNLKKLIPVVVRELKIVAKKHPTWNGQKLVAALTARSTSSTAPWWPYAQKAYAEWVAGANRKTDAYEFTRGEPNGSAGEDTWEAITRMATEVGWRCWCDEGTVYFVSEEYMVQRPITLTFTETSEGVNSIDWSQEGGKLAAECDVSVLAEAFEFSPGTPVAIEGEGPANGKWIVKTITQSVFSVEARLTLTRAQPRLAEPKGDIGALATAPLSKRVDNTVPASVRRMIAKANKINGGTYMMRPNGSDQYDCSEAVSLLLMAGGYLSGLVSTIQLNGFGAPGRGKYFTVYSEGGGGASGHCWLVFEKASGIEKTFEYHGPRGTRGGWKGGPKRTGMGSKNVRHVRGL